MISQTPSLQKRDNVNLQDYNLTKNGPSLYVRNPYRQKSIDRNPILREHRQWWTGEGEEFLEDVVRTLKTGQMYKHHGLKNLLNMCFGSGGKEHPGCKEVRERWPEKQKQAAQVVEMLEYVEQLMRIVGVSDPIRG